MKNIKRAIVSITILLFALCMLPGSVMAASKPKIMTMTFWENSGFKYGIHIENLPSTAQIIKYTSSKPAVLKVDSKKGICEGLKAGKSKVTVKYKVGTKTYSVSAVFTVKKTPNIFQYVKINGKKINLKKYPYLYELKKFTGTKAKITYKLNRGWKLSTAYGFDENGEGSFTPKNGKYFEVKKGKESYVYFEFKKGNDTLKYGVWITR